MVRYLLLIILTGLSFRGYAQDGILKGYVLDTETKTPLDLATINLLSHDSLLIGYQLSDGQGRFSFDKLPVGTNMRLTVSYTGYLVHSSVVLISPQKKMDTLQVLMTINVKDTNAVVVTAAIPIQMNGDTLEINPGAFKLKSDATVEELLNQVPGMIIWSDGSITVNGKLVNNVLVDGKPFMGATDPRIATQNLPRNAIDKIQLYEEFDRNSIGEQLAGVDSLLTMNIQLKPDNKRGFFGKAGAGAGTSDRFESDLSVQMFTAKSSGGIGGGINNINRNIAGLQEIFSNNTYRNSNPNLYNVGSFNGRGVNEDYALGGMYTYNFIKATNSRQNNRLTLRYNTSGSSNYLTELRLQERTTASKSQFINDDVLHRDRDHKNEFSFNYAKTNSYNDNLQVNGAFNTTNSNRYDFRLSEVTVDSGVLQSTNQVNTIANSKNDNGNLTLVFAKSDADNPLKNFTLNLNSRFNNSEATRNVTSKFESFTDPSKNADFDRQYVTTNHTTAVNGTLTYNGFKRLLLGRYDLFGIDIQLRQVFNYNRTEDNAVVSDYDSAAKQYTANNLLTNQNGREAFEYHPTLSLSKSFPRSDDAFSRNLGIQFRIIEDIRIEKNTSTIAERNLDRTLKFFRYEGGVNFVRQLKQKYRYDVRLQYVKNFQYPTINQLYTIVDDINVYNIRLGNPFLKNTVQHRSTLGFNFNSQQPKSPYAINASLTGAYNISINPITDSVINDASGKRIHYFVNADQGKSINGNYNLNISRKIEKSRLEFSYVGNLAQTTTPNFVDQVANINKTFSSLHQLNLQFALRSLLIVNVGRTMQEAITRQSAAKLRSFTNTTQTTKMSLVLHYPKNFTWSSTADHIENSNLKNPTLLWNAFAAYRLMKQQAEIKVAAMDLLKQYQYITNSTTPFGTVTSVTNGLQQYFLITLSYYPRQFGSTRAVKKKNNF